MNMCSIVIKVGLGIFAGVGAFNNIFVRWQEIEEFFDFKAGEIPLTEIIFKIINYLSFFPEFAYNFNRNTNLSHSLIAIAGANNKLLPCAAAFVGASLTGIGHGFIFYAGYEECDTKTYGYDALPIGKKALFITLSSAGGLQEFFHSGLELAEMASREPSLPFFYNSDTDNVFGAIENLIRNVIGDIFFNFILCTAAIGEFALFHEEIDHLFPHGYRYGLEFLSIVSASMFLVHEGQMLLQFFKRPYDILAGIRDREELIYWRVGRGIFLGTAAMNAFVTGFSRAQALHDLLHSYPVIRVIVSIASGMSRFSALCLPADHFYHPNPPENRSLKYTALQQGRDIIYEASFIALMNMFINDAGVNINTAWVWGIVAGMASECASFILDACNNAVQESIWKHLLSSILVDGAIAPTIGIGTFCVLKAYIPALDNFRKSTATVMTTLVVRHLLRKLLSQCWLGEPENRERNYTNPTIPYTKLDSCEEKNQDTTRRRRIGYCEKISSFFGGFFYRRTAYTPAIETCSPPIETEMTLHV